MTDEDDSPVLEEVELVKSDGVGKIRFLTTSSFSKAITGNGVDGDDRIVWDRRFLDQIKEARTKFYELIKKGFLAFLIGKDGQKSNRRMCKFDPNAEEILMVPPIAGG